MPSLNEVLTDYGLEDDEAGRETGLRILRAIESPDNGVAWESATSRLKFYHGTSWESAQHIMMEGFEPSDDGQLGRGVYVARQDKAARFARDAARHGGAAGGLVEVIVSFSFPKFVSKASDAGEWQLDGFDACRADCTAASEHMEWCIKDASQVKVEGIERVAVEGEAGVSPVEEGATVTTSETKPPPPAPRGWGCACGAASNPAWHPCLECGAAMPLGAIGEAVRRGMHALSRAHDHASVAERAEEDEAVAYRVGAMGGWMVAMDAARTGAPLPAAFRLTPHLLPPSDSRSRCVWAERVTAM